MIRDFDEFGAHPLRGPGCFRRPALDERALMIFGYNFGEGMTLADRANHVFLNLDPAAGLRLVWDNVRRVERYPAMVQSGIPLKSLRIRSRYGPIRRSLQVARRALEVASRKPTSPTAASTITSARTATPPAPITRPPGTASTARNDRLSGDLGAGASIKESPPTATSQSSSKVLRKGLPRAGELPPDLQEFPSGGCTDFTWPWAAWRRRPHAPTSGERPRNEASG
jgi:hypothetical protein